MITECNLEDIEPIIDAPRLMDRETGQSYLGRLVAYYGCLTINEFCQDFALDQRGIQWGRQQALRHLAKLTGADPDALVRWTPVRLTSKRHRIGDVEFMTDLGSRSMIMQCPVCAREAIASNPSLPPELCLYGRAEWALGYIQTCHLHNVRLVVVKADTCVIERADPAYLRASVFQDLEYIAVEASEPTVFERYALDTLLGNPTARGNVVGALSLASLVRFALNLGLDVAKHHGLTDFDDRTLRGLGFAAASGGTTGLLKLFAEMRDPLPSGQLAKAMVPNLLEYLARSKQGDVADLKPVIVDLLFRSLPCPPGKKLLGVACKERTLHTFASARRHYEVPWALLLAFARGTPGLAPRLSETKTNILIDREKADELFLGRTPFVSAGQLRDYLGRNPQQAGDYLGMLVEAGVLRGPIKDDALHSYPPTFSLPQVKQEVAKFLAPFARAAEPPEGLVSIRTAIARTKISLIGLMTLLAQRRLSRVVIVEDRSVMDSIYVESREIFEVLTGEADPVSIQTASGLLGINSDSLNALLGAGHLRHFEPNHPSIKCNIARLVAKADVDAFIARFARLRETCRMTGGTSVRNLRARGLEPAIFIDLEKKDQGRVVFYERQAIARFVARS